MNRIDWKARGREAKLLMLCVVTLLVALFIFDKAMDARLAAHAMQVERRVERQVTMRQEALADALLQTLSFHARRYDWLLHECVEPSTDEQWVMIPGEPGAELPHGGGQ